MSGYTIDSNLLLNAVNSANDGVVITDAGHEHHPIVFVNSAFERITGYTADEILGKNCRFLQADDDDQRAKEVVRKALEEGKSCRVKLKNYRKDGQLFWNELSISPVLDNSGVITHFIGVQKDFTEQQRLRDSLYAKSMEDQLTGLFNRRGFFILAEKQIKLARRSGKAVFSMLSVDIDDLKKINDSYGHMNGDRAITFVGKYLAELSRKSDVVSRFGGDEFLALLQGETSAAEGFLVRLKGKLDELNKKKVFPFSITVSVGRVDFDPEDTRSIDDLIHEADVSMYEEKKATSK